MSIIYEIIEEAELYYKTTGNIPKKLYLDVESYAEFMIEVHDKHSHFYTINDDEEPFYFNSMKIIKITKNWRIE